MLSTSCLSFTNMLPSHCFLTYLPLTFSIRDVLFCLCVEIFFFHFLGHYFINLFFHFSIGTISFNIINGFLPLSLFNCNASLILLRALVLTCFINKYLLRTYCILNTGLLSTFLNHVFKKVVYPE